MTPIDVALAAHDAGICVVRVKTDGSKMPMSVPGWGQLDKATGEIKAGWKRFQTERPTRQMVESWFANGHQGIGYITGAVSGDLVMLELEGRAVDEGLADQLIDAFDDAGHTELLDRLTAGYCETTPSGGIHFLYRLTDGVMLGSIKLAMRPSTEAELARDSKTTRQTLIETRGEGGFTVAAPSHGTVHPTGKAWTMLGGSVATIPTLTGAEQAIVLGICKGLSSVTPSEPPKPPKPVANKINTGKYTGRVGASWFDAVVEHLAATTTMAALLEQYGWKHSHANAYTRPGKTHGVSATINANDRLIVFSTSTPFKAYEGEGPAPSYDHLDVIAMYEHGNDRNAAAKRIAKDTGIWRERLPMPVEADRPQALSDDSPSPPAPSSTNLPDSFWQARPALAHIRQAAHSRYVSADSTLLAVLSRVCVQVPPSVNLPAVIGSVASLNFIGAIVAESGIGKTAAMSVATELVPINQPGIDASFVLGSGEGIPEAFLGAAEDVVGVDGKKHKVRPQVRIGVLANVDEGEALAEMAKRSGQTIMPTLRMAWSGSTLGQGNASADTIRRVAAGAYRFAAIIGIQPAHAVAFLSDKAGGTPQRFVWLSSSDPTLPNKRPTWPGPLEMKPPEHYTFGTVIGLAEAVEGEVVSKHLAAARLQLGAKRTDDEQLDGHARLVQLKVSALLAILDGRTNITEDDWQLGATVMATSGAVRRTISIMSQLDAQRSETASTAKAIRRETTLVDSAETRARQKVTTAILGVVRKSPGVVVTEAVLWRAPASRNRDLVDRVEVFADLVAQGELIADGNGYRAAA